MNYFYTFLFVLSLSIYSQAQEKQKVLYSQLNDELQCLKKAYYEHHRLIKLNEGLAEYDLRKNLALQKNNAIKLEAENKIKSNQILRKKQSQAAEDSRISRKIALSEEIKQIKFKRNEYRINKKETLNKNISDLNKKNTTKLKKREDKKQEELKINEKKYESKIEQRRKVLLSRYYIE